MSTEDLFLRACRREPVKRTPVWIMRQAGRYLPEYRALRQRVDFRTLCSTPDLAAEASLQPLRRFPLDAAIVFSDIMAPLQSMGVEVDFAPGPVLAKPLRDRASVEALREPAPEEVAPATAETIRILTRELGGKVPVIGFAGAPLTVAAYLVEGKGSKDFSRFRAFLRAEPEAADLLLGKLARTTVHYLRAQVEAGAGAVQLFDTWAGLLDPATYSERALPHVQAILSALSSSGVPRIYFAPGSAHLGDLPSSSGADVLGVDWRTDLREARRVHGDGFAYQGNLDPAWLLAPGKGLEEAVCSVLDAAPDRGHIFNLGHGILPDTPLESVETILRVVHDRSAS